jgi:hypothetical protein
MNRTTRTRQRVRHALAAMLIVGALNAFGGGYYGLSGAPGVPIEWLQGSPFTDYTIPSWILLVIVGGSLLISGVAVLTTRPISRAASVFSSVVLLTWIAAQLGIIGYVSWMQPVTLAWGLIILALSVYLPQQHDAPPPV